jgi:transaldolase/glucose-6-phosphate isomerase
MPEPSYSRFKLANHAVDVEERLAAWQKARFSARLWQKDHTLWVPEPVPELTDRLGWLDLPESARSSVAEWTGLAEEVKASGTEQVVLLGMGGSSLAPEVFQRTFGKRSGYPELIVLDSTHPGAVRWVESRLNLRRALFVVSSKSGTTTETLSLFQYFWQRVSETRSSPGKQFIAITDPNTPLEKLASSRGFRAVLHAPEDVGGRYSALTAFGMAPAALIGVDIERVLQRAQGMRQACSPSVPASENPGLILGAVIGEAAAKGRDKVTIITSSSLQAFPAWIEQLIAESTGKNGKGIVPVVDEELGDGGVYGHDRLFVSLQLKGDADITQGSEWSALERSVHPVVRIDLADAYDLGREFYRWEIAVAAAGSVLGINPFDQPDVQLAKDLARQAMEKQSAKEDAPAAAAEGIPSKESVLRALSALKAGDYFSIQAYVPPVPEAASLLQKIRIAVRDRFRVATTLGFGPRFLHSTGQLHKGGPNSGVFWQLTDDPADDLPVPETRYTFGRLIKAQAAGDQAALRQRGRRVQRLNLGKDIEQGLEAILSAVTNV